MAVRGISRPKNERSNDMTDQPEKSDSWNSQKKLLVTALSNAGVSLQQNRSYTKKELQEIARIRGVGLFEDKEHFIPGWQGRPKGLLQALWERGMIDEQMLDKYTLDGRKHPITGIVDLQYSLRHLLSECKDLVWISKRWLCSIFTILYWRIEVYLNWFLNVNMIR